MESSVEPWLRGTLGEHDAVRRQVLHALQLAEEDVRHWCDALNLQELWARPFGVAPVGFHLRHIARSLDRLLTYAEGRQLSREQTMALRAELDEGAPSPAPIIEFRDGLRSAQTRIAAFDNTRYEEAREVGRNRLPATLGGLLVHLAEHTQRHVGQAVTTSQVVAGMRDLPGRSEPAANSPRR